MKRIRKHLEEMEYPHPHIGNLIAKVLRDKHISQAEAARRMNVSSSTISGYLSQPSIQFGILWKLCIVLKHDFLSELKGYYPPYMPVEKENEHLEKIQELEKEIEVYQSALKLVSK